MTCLYLTWAGQKLDVLYCQIFRNFFGLSSIGTEFILSIYQYFYYFTYIAEYIKLNDPKLEALITNVDTHGPGASVKELETTQPSKPVGNPGGWSINSFMNS